MGVAAAGVYLVLGPGIAGDSAATSSNTASLPPAATPLKGSVTLGDEQPVGGATSSTTADTTLTAPAGGPLAGLSVVIPAGAYSVATTFHLGARPLTLTGYDGKLTSLSDLVVIENGGAYAATPMTVTVPVTLPDGWFAMGVHLRDDGSLEPMPLVTETPTSVTVMTRHFSSFLIVAIAEAALPANIGTGFRVREDDIQTPNYGSYVSPGGHCAGQSLAEMWYFAVRRAAGSPALWGLTDNDGRGGTMDFWQDDSRAYRLASSVHEDLVWSTLSARVAYFFEKAKVDRLQWDAFRYAMLISGQPQFVGLSVGDQGGGHVIVAYAATPSGIWVADPNFPGALRQIAWNARSADFTAYASGASAAESDELYDRIAFWGTTSLIEWGQIGERWAELDAGTIGDDRFPGAGLARIITTAEGAQDVELLADGPVDSVNQRFILASDPSIPMRATLYEGTRQIGQVSGSDEAKITLAYGINDLGVYFEAQRNGSWEAVQFKRYAVTAPPPDLPTQSAGLPTVPPLPTGAPRPTPARSSEYDCSNPPASSKTSLAYINWSLHCQAIQPAP